MKIYLFVSRRASTRSAETHRHFGFCVMRSKEWRETLDRDTLSDKGVVSSNEGEADGAESLDEGVAFSVIERTRLLGLADFRQPGLAYARR